MTSIINSADAGAERGAERGTSRAAPLRRGAAERSYKTSTDRRWINSDFGRIAELQNGVDTHLHPQSLLFQGTIFPREIESSNRIFFRYKKTNQKRWYKRKGQPKKKTKLNSTMKLLQILALGVSSIELPRVNSLKKRSTEEGKTILS